MSAQAKPRYRTVPELSTHFMKSLYGGADPALYVNIFSLPSKRSEWFPAADLDAAGDYAADQAENVYFGLGLHRTPPKEGRGGAAAVCAVPAIGFDLDFAGPAHAKKRLPPRAKEASTLLQAFPLRPSMVLHTGNGLQAFWILREPWVFGSEAEREYAGRLSKGVQNHLRILGRERGWDDLDQTGDLARVFRVPGTLNRKNDPAPLVRILRDLPANRYNPDDFEPYIAEAPRKLRVVPAGPAVKSESRELSERLEELHDALNHIDPGPYDTWLRVGMAIHDATGGSPDGFWLWDTWSKGSDKYDPDVTGLKWDTFTPGAGVTLNSIFRDAIDAGWTPPRNREPKQAGTSTSVDTGAGGTIEMSYRNDNLPARVDSEPVALPTIKVRPELNAVTDEALQAIGAAKLGVYVRGRQLVEVVRDGTEAPAWIKRPPGAPSISRIDKARVSGLLDTSGRYTKHVRREKIDVPITPPAWIAEQILSRPSWPLPYLEGIIEAPTLRPDGSILCTPGHDEATGLLYIPPPGADAWPAIPEDPDERQLREAVAALMEPFADFPFVSGTDKSACLAAVLTIIGRPMIRGPVPMFVVEAPTPATGKSLCAEAVIALATGLEPSTTSLPHSEAELQKRVLAIAEGGYPVVLLDNISGTVGSDTLAAALTTTTWQGRRLGATEEVVVPLRAVWIATGNNPHYKATLGRRVVPIRLDAKQEHPEDRGGFRHPDLLAFVRKERPRLVAAALTILRAFHVAGRPHHGKPRMGSYNAWDDLVRSALVMAGQDDPAATDNPQSGRGRIRAQSDDDLNTLAVALAEMHRVIGDEKVTSSAILKAASDQSVAGDDRLRDALEAWATDRAGRLTPKSLGMKASTVDGRQVGGLVLRSVKDLGYPTRISIEVRAPAGEE